MAAGAGQHAGGDAHVAGTDPGRQLCVTARYAFPIEALAGFFLGGEVQGQGLAGEADGDEHGKGF
ncbi:hypothetical protein D3C76_1479510 [compost metagenome]